jgi:RNA polymerase sigma factor (sigma-70 family)
MASPSFGTVVGRLHRFAAGTPRDLSDAQLLQRFARDRDQAAFAALFERHGRLVWSVCRNRLGHEQDAEDALQATFLVLARNAGLVRKQASLGSWLHGVAYRIAMKAKREAARRRARERSAAPSEQAAPVPEGAWRALQAALDEEVQNLPEKLRVPFVLCCLEGRSQPEVAEAMGWKLGTVSGRLSQARQRLRERLERRGVSLPAALTAVVLARESARAAVPAHLAEEAVAALTGLGGEGASIITASARLAGLVQGASPAMKLTTFKFATALLLAAGALALGVQLITDRPLAAEPAGKAPNPEAAAKDAPKDAPAKPDAQRVELKGRVLGPDGKPFRGAKVTLYRHEAWPERQAATSVVTGEDGGFRIATDRETLKFGITLVASGDGCGPDWEVVYNQPDVPDFTLRLAEDEPVSGQVVDLEGRPVAGARLRLLVLSAPKEKDLAEHFHLWDIGKTKSPAVLLAAALPENIRAVTADAEGRFRLAGIGRERLATAVIEGPGIASIDVLIMTTAGPLPKVRHPTPVYGAKFKHVAAPTKPVVGVVRDKDTNRPLAGVTIRSSKLANIGNWHSEYVSATTDAEGRYRLVGLPMGKGNVVEVIPPKGEPYLGLSIPLDDPPGADPLTLDIGLKRGLWVEGKLTAKAVGGPLPQWNVLYFSLLDNPHLKEVGATLSAPVVYTGKDGSFRLVALPGPGLVAVQDGGLFLTADQQDGFGSGPFFEAAPYAIPLRHYSLSRINPAADAKALKHDIALEPGDTIRGKVLGPDGKPLTGVWGFGVVGRGYWSGPLKSEEFSVTTFNRERPRPVLFVHPEKNLAAALIVPRDKKAEVSVKLEPAGALVGRLVDSKGKPPPGVILNVSFLLELRSFEVTHHHPADVTTDDQGRFRIPCVMPGYEYLIYDAAGQRQVASGHVDQAGQTKDLGDVGMPSSD